ncbi:lytic murein transglycosylase [Oceaniglobus roseus]|uniref:lytic murein transglycosylase n=1 Tax=Oceaniglobus roseus TaxID=1737570 RepID=UPI000C7F180E|nr:lytic murein transglycosylase [Kandeliimicrobium roseum]
MRPIVSLSAAILWLGTGLAGATPVPASLSAHSILEIRANAPRTPRLTEGPARAVPAMRPRARPDSSVVPAQGAPDPAVDAQLARKARGFDTWATRFRGRALAQGISGTVFDRAFEGVTYDPAVIERDRNQSEFTKTIWDYLDTAVSDLRVSNGKAALAREKAALDRIEARYDVDREVVVAIWGLESAYGTFKGSNDVVQSLATLAYDGRRGRFFESQLVAALKILQSGDVAPRGMTGSWAGAMGHTQFIPTSYLTYAVDLTGDGKRDIWGDDPADALASTAAYLKRYGWTKGQPWGVEVTLPKGFDYASARRDVTKLPSEWAKLGVVGVDGKPVRDHARASVLLPAGAQGAAFLVFPNFAVIERYNTADAYVIGVGHLADRIAGGAPIRAAWPRGDRALTFDERKEMQRRLTAQGFDTKGIDGKIGPLTIEAVRSFQRAIGQAPDGYASLAILEKLR